MTDTRRRFAFNNYDPTSYDDNFCLKPPLFLWLAIVYLSRALLLPFIGGITSMSGSSDMASVTRGLTSPTGFIPAAFSVLVLIAYMRRRPGASRLTRFFWTHGRTILALSAVVDLALVGQILSQEFSTDSIDSMLQVLRALLDVYFLIFIFVLRRVRDAFTDFPAPMA